jgi:hypothetical protein
VRSASRLVVLALSLASGVAIAATTGPLSLPAAAQAELDKEIANTWSVLEPSLVKTLTSAVAGQSGSVHGNLTIDSLALTSQSFTAPPRVAITPIVTAGVYAGEHLQADLPGNGATWSLEISGQVTYDLHVKLLFFTVTKHLTESFTIDVTGIHASEGLDLDTSDPTLPVCTKTGNIQLDYKLGLKVGNPILNVLVALLQPVIDKLLRQHVDAALQGLDAQIAPLAGLPNKTPYGSGAPPRAPFGQQPDLEKAALGVDADIQQWHLPYGTILGVVFSDPTYGQGTPVGYTGHGDSAIWSGHYLAGESFRYAVTKDPAAATNAARSLAGIEDLLDAEKPGGGQLSRCVVPIGALSAAGLQTDPTSFTTMLHGKPYVALDHISRDQYLGVMLGLGCAYDFLDDPTQKALAASLISRVVDYLVASDWVAMQHDQVSMSAPFIQSADKMVMFTALAAHVAPRFQAVRDEVGPLAYVQWLGEWTGLLDPLGGYYSWNLGTGARYHEMRLETDPGRFMAEQRAHAMERRGIGHHENAWFQTVDAAVDPTLAATVAPEILDELRRWTARSRRQFTATNSKDPTIEQATYSVPLSFQKNPSGTGTLVPVTVTEAKYPIAVEKRCATDYLWQRDPFQLDGNGDPHEQAPGVDLVLPYWMARYYKLVP